MVDKAHENLAQRMASMMCVDINLALNPKEVDQVHEYLDNNGKLSVETILKLRVKKVQEKGDDLELEELNIDNDVPLSLDF